MTAGDRRLAALKPLVKQKRLAKNAPVPCIVNSGNFARLSIVLGDEDVGVALCIGDVSQRQMNDAGAMTIVDLVFVDGSAHGPANLSPFLILQLFDRFFRQGDHAAFQMFETDVAKRSEAMRPSNCPSWDRFLRHDRRLRAAAFRDLRPEPVGFANRRMCVRFCFLNFGGVSAAPERRRARNLRRGSAFRSSARTADSGESCVPARSCRVP